MLKKTLLLFTVVSSMAWANGVTANTVMENFKWREDGTSRVAEVTLKIIDKDGDIRERSVDYIEKDTQQNRNTILYVKSPKDVSKTTILLKNDSSRKGATESEIWLYVPVLGKTKKLSSMNKNGNFVGSNFQYSDLEWTILEDFSYKLITEERIQGQKTYKIEAVANSADVTEKTGYSKKILWINPEYNLIVQADYYDKKGFYAKRLTVKKIERISGYWTVMEQVIENFLEEQKTVMQLSNVKYNVEIADSVFSRQKLGEKFAW